MPDEAAGSSIDDGPLKVRMRQGMPTRINVDGVRYRFGINSWSRGDQTVYFTVLRGEDVTGYRVSHGDRVGILGREWRVSKLTVPADGAVRVWLDEIAEPGR